MRKNQDNEENFTFHEKRATLNIAEKIYSNVLMAVLNTYEHYIYTELWYSLYDKMPLSSNEEITLEHMKDVANFVEKRNLISNMLYAITTPRHLDINEINNTSCYKRSH